MPDDDPELPTLRCPVEGVDYIHGELKGYAPPDNVNSPPHYRQGGMEVIDAIEGLGLDKDFCLGNVVKYCARWQHKGGVTDLEKAMWYLQRRIARAKAESNGCRPNPTA